MKTLKLIKFVDGKDEIVLEQHLPDTHEMFKLGGWPEVIVRQEVYWGLMDFDNDKADYSPTSGFVLE